MAHQFGTYAIATRTTLFGFIFGLATLLLSGCESKIDIQVDKRAAPELSPDGNDSPGVDDSDQLDPPESSDLTQYVITGPSAGIHGEMINITWENAGAASYMVLLSTSTNCETPVHTFPNVASTTQAAPPMPDGIYYICVYAIAKDGSLVPAKNNGYRITVDRTPPGSFQLVTPQARVNTLRPRVSWNAAADANFYQLRVARDTSCNDVLQTYDRVEGTTVALKPLQNGSSYFLCLSALDKSNNRRTINAAFTVDTTIPTAQYRDVPADGSTDAAMNAVVFGTDVRSYRYAIVAGAGASCGTAAYSSFRSIGTPMTQALGSPGVYKLCLLGQDSYGNVQETPTVYSWVRNNPASFVLATPAGEIVAENAVTAVNYAVSGL